MQHQEKSLRARSITLSVSFIVAGLMAYVLMAIAKRNMTPAEFSAFSVFWSFGFFVAASVGPPIEQELTRTVAHRDAHSQPIDDLVRSALAMALVMDCCAILLAALIAMSGVLKGLRVSATIIAAFAILIVGESLTCIVRGILAGRRDTSTLAFLVTGQSVVRALFVVLALSIHDRVGWAALGVAASALTFLTLANRLNVHRVDSSTQTMSSGLSRSAVVRLVAAAPFAAAFSVGTPAMASLIASRGERDIIGDVLAALSLTSAPVLVAAALQTVLLPTVVRSLLVGDSRLVRTTTRRITAVVLALSIVAASVMGTFGPWLLGVLFGRTRGVGRWQLAAMALGAGLLFLANLLAPVCVARRSHGSVTRAWAAGAITLLGLILIPGHLATRVSIGVVGGAAVVVGSLMGSLRSIYASETTQPGNPRAALRS